MSDDLNAADKLAAETARDREVFAAEALPIPELNDLESVEDTDD